MMTKPLKQGFFVILLFCLAVVFVTATAAQKKSFPISPGKSCISSSCHSDMAKKKYVHAVAADGAMCVLCHQVPKEGRHRFKLIAEGGTLCAQCHGNKADKKYKHAPVAAGLCTFCHDPHQSDNPKQLKLPPTAELCLTCHNQKTFKGAVVHGPVADGQCIKCHNPHTSDHPKQLEAAVPDLCFGCHDKPQKDAKGRRLPPVKTTFTNKEVKQHLPFKIGACLWCHNPHTSKNFRLLKKAYPESFYTSYSKDKYICFNCHSEKAFSEPRTLTDTKFRNGNLNLHYRHVNRKKGRTCRACHDHHGAKRPKLIRERVPFGKRYISINKYEKTDTGGTCAPMCHTSVSYDRYDPVKKRFKVTPRQGVDATAAELEKDRKMQMRAK